MCSKTNAKCSNSTTRGINLKSLIPIPIKKIINGIICFFQKQKLYIDLYSDLKEIKRQQKETDNKDFIFGRLYPCLLDKTANNGSAKGHYFHQDLLVARRVFENNPDIHFDIGSSVSGFVSHVASFREITVIDIRPSVGKSHNITFVQQDFMKDLDKSLIYSCDSLSCLHAIEHFGLGRYGDPINYNGHLIGMNNLYKMLKKDGTLYFSVPIGEPQQIQFHAHRIFSVKYLLKQFDGKYDLINFSYVDDKGDLFENVKMTDEYISNSFNCKYGCGIFELRKI